MNKKTFEATKYSAMSLKRVYNAFGADKYGDWTFQILGSTSHAVASEEYLYGSHWYAGNGAYIHGNANATRIIPNLRKAKKISFEFNTINSGTGNGYLALTSFWLIDIGGLRIASVYSTNTNEILVGNFSQQGTFKVVVTQEYVIVNDVLYDYPSNWKLKDSSNDKFFVQLYPDGSCAGYAFEARIWVYPPQALTVEW